MLANRIDRLVGDLRCPACKNKNLSRNDLGFVCIQCQAAYPIKNGCPIILDKSSLASLESELSTPAGMLMLEEYAASEGKNKSLWQKILHLLTPPQVLYDYNPQLSKSHTLPLFNHNGQNTSVLNVGGGPHRYSEIEVTMNLRPFYNVDIVGDAHNIPFADNVFDTVICNAVLEHVYSPEQVVKEMYRVLKPGGMMYAEVPFIFFFHGYPNDFQRYTKEGIKRLFSALSITDIGLTQGPISTALQCSNIAFESLIPSRLRLTRKAFNGVYRWIFFGFKYLDKFMENNQDAHRMAGGFYMLGSKPIQKQNEYK